MFAGRSSAMIEPADRSMLDAGAMISHSSSATRLSDQLIKAAFGITLPAGGATAGMQHHVYVEFGRAFLFHKWHNFGMYFVCGVRKNNFVAHGYTFGCLRKKCNLFTISQYGNVRILNVASWTGLWKSTLFKASNSLTFSLDSIENTLFVARDYGSSTSNQTNLCLKQSKVWSRSNCHCHIVWNVETTIIILVKRMLRKFTSVTFVDLLLFSSFSVTVNDILNWIEFISTTTATTSMQ